MILCSKECDYKGVCGWQTVNRAIYVIKQMHEFLEYLYFLLAKKPHTFCEIDMDVIQFPQESLGTTQALG